MDWINGMCRAIDYIEENLDGELDTAKIASQAYVSSFYFQKAFTILCGFTVSEYVRRRRLALAGHELMTTDAKVIDVAVKYGYDSPDSFAKAFTRFHGVTPVAVKRDGAIVKSFAPLKIKFTLEGGNTMEYRIVEKEAFTVVGFKKAFAYNEGYVAVPKFWEEHVANGNRKKVCGVYGISVDKPDHSSFTYFIADDYVPWREFPEGAEALTIKKHTWAVFPIRGIKNLQPTNTKIFCEWLPNCKDYEIAEEISIELYSNPSNYEGGTASPDYYSEMWIPLKKK